MTQDDPQTTAQSQPGGQAEIECRLCDELSEAERVKLGAERLQAAMWQCPKGHLVCAIHAPEQSLEGDLLRLRCRVCGEEWLVALGAAP